MECLTQSSTRRLCRLFRTITTATSSNAGSVSKTSPPAPVCLVLGGGAGIGQAVATKFGAEGFTPVCVRRGGGPNRLLKEGEGSMDSFLKMLRETIGITGYAYYADATNPEDIASVVRAVEESVGPIHVAVYNVGAQIGNRSVEKTSYRIFDLALKLGAFGAFAMAKEVVPFMEKRGKGSLIFTSATAAFRGNRGQHAHAAAMGARRNLCQSLNHELAEKGIHVAHVNLDGVVASPETSLKVIPEAYHAHLASDDGMILPSAVADAYWYLHNQPRSSWTFEMDVRPWRETPWFNSS